MLIEGNKKYYTKCLSFCQMNITDITDNKFLSNLKTDIQMAMNSAWECSKDIINIGQLIER